ncbi:ABC transporter substrate-binding protein [Verminephrobacter eiseniae]|uniref:ABC transporter substrate-binding protein n=1 Tax=Verminephrobacter eiseniae TaxID=364317 RepID=UPI00223813FC|nr:ABC transporter substrate-binding protein [Verminephrobacter eiseniae]MCW5233477.1 ABC transporter ATP-binding protein [Verminephrobacter eiseniae]MCW5261631.1 ABC transporter ATP-binding protein [Verminephrobacter eiseniae]MCW5294970.1 ABC transporter ATP-binding protein [Verminephrobacter eiseniae]MCW8184236.1 ABC transporter ATP-binding protein [Verminephrobacter eiseniae]MCW8222773.1 ABC transporter ATP-binding protein [Verminephrobacter eiseniae]
MQQTVRLSLRLPLGSFRCATLAALAMASGGAYAQAKEIKVGVVYDMSGPLAAGGSYPSYLGTKYAIDAINERGGVEGVKIRPIYVDAQSKVDVAINEAERLVNQEKVDLVLGIFTSSQCVPLAQKLDAAKKFFWATVCTSTAAFKDRKLTYAFRGQIHSDQYGWASCTFLRDMAKDKLKKDPKDLRVAIIHEDGPYGSGAAQGSEENCGKKFGMQIVLKEGYAATAPDLSPLVTKLKRVRADVILHTGYNPDITMFLRQAKEQNLKWQALIGHGSGYGQWDKLYGTFGNDANLIFNVDAVAAQLIPAASLAPGLGDVTKDMVRRYKAENKGDDVPAHVSMGMNQTWIFLTDVLPRAIKKYDGFDAEALRKASLDTDIPEGGTIQGYGVKFLPPGDPLAGQNERSSPVVMQYIGNKTEVVWPLKIKTADAVMPLPKTNPYSAQR